jgi:hypothetical protein
MHRERAAHDGQGNPTSFKVVRRLLGEKATQVSPQTSRLLYLDRENAAPSTRDVHGAGANEIKKVKRMRSPLGEAHPPVGANEYSRSVA